MFWIAGSLLSALILSWFGFDTVVQTGMKEVFDVTLTHTGYYFLFGLIGMLKFVISTPKSKPAEFNFSKDNKVKK